MFTPAVQRIVWKEFRAQRAIWFGIAFELVLLQLWQGMFPQHFQINLFSIACVLTGVLAMTSSALLFAGESEAQTDGFLRQLPFRSRDLLLGKLGFCVAAVASFLGFSLLTGMLVDALTSGGSSQSREFEGMMLYAHIIGGLWAWGIFYSLITRKVMWTLVGAGLTEIFVNAVLYGTLNGNWQPDSRVTAIYGGLVGVVFLIDAWLLSQWYSGGSVFPGVSHSLARLEADELTLASTRPLPWARSWKITSRVGIAYGVFWNVVTFASFTRAVSGYGSIFPLILLIGIVGAVAGTVIVIGMRTFRLLSSEHSQTPGVIRSVFYSFQFSNILKQVFRLLGLIVVSIFALGLGIYVGMSIANLLTYGFVDWHTMQEVWLSKGVKLSVPTSEVIHFMVRVSVAMTLVGGFVLWGVGRLLDTSEKKHNSPLGIRTLQFAQSTFQSINRGWGSLLWVESRRALPFLIGGAVLLGVIAVFMSTSRETSTLWGLLSLTIISYTCGLLTILPDRSQGTLSLLIERGVPAWRILAAKLVVWALTLGLLAIIPSVLCNPLWTQINKEQAIAQLGAVGLGTESGMVSPATLFLGGLNAGLFAIGALSAAWIRRPILAVFGGVVGVILWVIWCAVLSENHSLFGMAIIWPLGMWIIGYFAAGTTTLLEQVNWKSRARRVAWVMWIVGGTFYWLRDFRIHEIPQMPGVERRQSLLTLHEQTKRPDTLRDTIGEDQERWGSFASAETTVSQLNLNLPDCNLAESLKSLATGLQVTLDNSRSAAGDSSLVEATRVRRLVLSAIRRWANHSQQTAALLEDASLQFESLNRVDQFSARELQAHQYAAAVQAIESGPPQSRLPIDQQPPKISPLVRPFLKLAGEQERVRRLVDLQFLGLFRNAISETSPDFAIWTRNTSLSLNALGVYLPNMNHVQYYAEPIQQCRISSQATVFVIQLQLYRLKTGQFPPKLVSVIKANQSNSILFGYYSGQFGYESQGFDHNLRISSVKALPAHQPVIYFRAEAPFPGVELVDPRIEGQAFYRAWSWFQGEMYSRAQQTSFENASHNQQAKQTQILAEAEGPVNPNEIQFVVLGRSQDEDRLCLPEEQQKSMTFEKLQEAIDRESSGQTNSEEQGSMSPSSETAPTVPPTPEIPPAPPESQAAESAPE